MTSPPTYIRLSDLGAPLAQGILPAIEHFGHFMQQEGRTVIERGFGRGIRQREDAIRNLRRCGGRIGPGPELARPAARTQIYGAVLARDDDVPERFEGLFRAESLIDSATRLLDRPVVQPFILVANLMLPGQILALHADVGEFRGVNRFNSPQWLLVAMRFSGLFEPWRIPIATATCYFGQTIGGDFVCYPDGVAAAPTMIPPRHNSAVVTDVDSMIHGVALVGEADTPPPPNAPGSTLDWNGSRFELTSRSGALRGRYDWNQIRLSISWKAHCFDDEADRRRVLEHSDDISPEWAVARLVCDLADRGAIRGRMPDQRGIAELIINQYILFPPRAGTSVDETAACRSGVSL